MNYHELKFQQARRREIPYRLALGFVCAIFAVVILGFLLNCGPIHDDARPLTKAERKANYDALWAGHEDAHKKRIP